MAVLEMAQSSLPDLNDESSFADNIMHAIEKSEKEKALSHTIKQIPFYQKTFFHYVVAAAMTILLMSTGVFQIFTSYVKEIQTSTFAEDKPSITEQLIETIYKQEYEREEE